MNHEIKVNELRVGNWVIMDGENDQFSIDDFHYKNYEIAKPIPLTRQILESDTVKPFADMFGVAILDTGYCILWHNYFQPYINGNKVYSYMKDSFGELSIKYVHELQNLYVALTGKELEVKL